MLEKKSSRTLINLIGVPSLVAIIIAGDTYNNLPIFSIFIGIVIFFGSREIPTLVNRNKGRLNSPVLLFFLAILQIDRHPLIYWDIPIYQLIIGITLAGMIWEIFRKESTPLLNISSLIFAFVWLGLMLGSLVLLRNLPNIGFSITLSLFLAIWICDTAAFGFGLKFGKSKILPSISPNKTWVGTIAGLISSLLIMISLYQFNFFKGLLSIYDILIVGLISGIFGQFGDFAESLLKREAKIKDTSNFLMGHGGILDRFDSLTFAAPITLYYCNYFIQVGK